MLTAREACAVSHLLTPTDFSIHKHIEVRIWDSIQHGGKSIIYAGELTNNVVNALYALGYIVTDLKTEDGTSMIRIEWEGLENASEFRRIGGANSKA